MTTAAGATIQNFTGSRMPDVSGGARLIRIGAQRLDTV
jgi:hypothetical protein